jgi:tetratricopeptide (TPR) repeat protein
MVRQWSSKAFVLASFRVLTFLALAVAGTANAQDYDAAGKHFASGQERFSQKRYRTAAMEFQAAYDITKDPVLLYNVGEAWQKAGEGKRAADAYRSYLKERPGAQDRADVERNITRIEMKKRKLVDESVTGDKEEAEGWMAHGGPPTPTAAPVAVAPAETSPVPDPARTTDAPPPPPAPLGAAAGTASVPGPEASTPPPATAPEPRGANDASSAKQAPPQPLGLLDDRPATKMRVAAWVGVATTLALLTTGAILGLAAQSRGDEVGRRLSYVDASNQPNNYDSGAHSDLNSLKSEGRLYNGLAIGFYSAAGAAAIATTALFVVDWRNRNKAPTQTAGIDWRSLKLAPVVAPGNAGLVVGGRF